jgi:hypothetical protein
MFVVFVTVPVALEQVRVYCVVEVGETEAEPPFLFTDPTPGVMAQLSALRHDQESVADVGGGMTSWEGELVNEEHVGGTVTSGSAVNVSLFSAEAAAPRSTMTLGWKVPAVV